MISPTSVNTTVEELRNTPARAVKARAGSYYGLNWDRVLSGVLKGFAKAGYRNPEVRVHLKGGTEATVGLVFPGAGYRNQVPHLSPGVTLALSGTYETTPAVYVGGVTDDTGTAIVTDSFKVPRRSFDKWEGFGPAVVPAVLAGWAGLAAVRRLGFDTPAPRARYCCLAMDAVRAGVLLGRRVCQLDAKWRPVERVGSGWTLVLKFSDVTVGDAADQQAPRLLKFLRLVLPGVEALTDSFTKGLCHGGELAKASA